MSDDWKEILPFKPATFNDQKFDLQKAIYLVNKKYSLNHLFQAIELNFEYYYSVSGWTEKCSCPFPDHDDGTASFYFHPEKNIFHCFGCQKSGGPVEFLAYLENLSLKESLEKILKKYAPSLKNYQEQDLQNRAIEIANLKLLQEYLSRIEGKINLETLEKFEKINWSLFCFLRQSNTLSSHDTSNLSSLLNKIKERIEYD